MLRTKMIAFSLSLGLVLPGCARESVVQEKNLSSPELSDLLVKKPDGLHLVDVRTPEEYAAGHIAGAVNIPVDTIADLPPTTDKQALIVVYCRSGSRSQAARNALLEKGFTNVIDFGGIGNWQGPLQEGAAP